MISTALMEKGVKYENIRHMGVDPGNDYGSVHRCAGNKTLCNMEMKIC